MKLLKQLPLAVSVAFLWNYSLHGGDKIITSDDKLRGDPTKDLKVGNELLKSRVKIDDSTPELDMPGVPSLPRLPMNRRDRQLLKDKQAERQNWLLFEPGELQRKHEQESTLGVDNNPINRLDKNDARDDGRQDFTFYGVGEKKSGQRQPGEIRAPGAPSKEEAAEARRAEQRARDDAEDDSRRSKTTFDLTGSTEAQASHTSSELNFSKLLQPDQKDTISGASGSKGEFSLGSIMGSGALRTKEQQAHADDFKNLLSPQSSLSLPVTAGPSLGSVPVGLASRPPDVSTRPPGSDFNPLAQNPANFNPHPSAMPSFNGTPGFNPSSPYQRPQLPSAADSSKNWLKPIEPMRRNF